MEQRVEREGWSVVKIPSVGTPGHLSVGTHHMLGAACFLRIQPDADGSFVFEPLSQPFPLRCTEQLSHLRDEVLRQCMLF